MIFFDKDEEETIVDGSWKHFKHEFTGLCALVWTQPVIISTAGTYQSVTSINSRFKTSVRLCEDGSSHCLYILQTGTFQIFTFKTATASVLLHTVWQTDVRYSNVESDSDIVVNLCWHQHEIKFHIHIDIGQIMTSQTSSFFVCSSLNTLFPYIKVKYWPLRLKEIIEVQCWLLKLCCCCCVVSHSWSWWSYIVFCDTLNRIFNVANIYIILHFDRWCQRLTTTVFRWSNTFWHLCFRFTTICDPSDDDIKCRSHTDNASVWL